MDTVLQEHIRRTTLVIPPNIDMYTPFIISSPNDIPPDIIPPPLPDMSTP
jgi:hypothetical protein